jgi:hypothetical protein
MKLYKEIDLSIYDRTPYSLLLENSDIMYPIVSLNNLYEQVVIYYLQYVTF